MRFVHEYGAELGRLRATTQRQELGHGSAADLMGRRKYNHLPPRTPGLTLGLAIYAGIFVVDIVMHLPTNGVDLGLQLVNIGGRIHGQEWLVDNVPRLSIWGQAQVC